MIAGTAISRFSAQGGPRALICGLPTYSTYFAADLCRDLLARRHGACEVIGLNELNPETAKKIAGATGPVVFMAEVPDATVAAMAAEADFPIIVMDQNFAAACHEFMGVRGAKLPDTVRSLARAQVGIHSLANIPRATTIVVDEPATSAQRLLEKLAVALGIEDDVWQPMVTARDLDHPWLRVLEATYNYQEKLSSSEEADDVLERLAQFYGLGRDRHAGAWHVPLVMLLEGTPPYLPATNPIELTGPARCLIFGPYLYLPRGRWTSRFHFSAAGNESTNMIGFEVTADNEPKFTQDFELRSAGKFEFECELHVGDAFSPFEFRVHLRRGAIGGRFIPVSLTIEPAE